MSPLERASAIRPMTAQVPELAQAEPLAVASPSAGLFARCFNMQGKSAHKDWSGTADFARLAPFHPSPSYASSSACLLLMTASWDLILVLSATYCAKTDSRSTLMVIKPQMRHRNRPTT